MELEVKEIQKASLEILEVINRLLPQLSKKAQSLNLNQLEDILNQTNFYLIVAYLNQEIVGLATLLYHKTLTKPNGFGHIEDVVVDQGYRGMGIGSLILKELCLKAKSLNLERIELTSNKKRLAANIMYQKCGFKIRETNVYSKASL